MVLKFVYLYGKAGLNEAARAGSVDKTNSNGRPVLQLSNNVKYQIDVDIGSRTTLTHKDSALR